jgi:hypothetical protein
MQCNAMDTCVCRAALGGCRTTVHRRFDAKETSAFLQPQEATSASIISFLDLTIISYSREVRQMLNKIKQTTFRYPTRPGLIFSDIPSATATYFSIFDVSILILGFPDPDGQTNEVYFKAIQLSQFFPTVVTLQFLFPSSGRFVLALEDHAFNIINPNVTELVKGSVSTNLQQSSPTQRKIHRNHKPEVRCQRAKCNFD